jgi:putative oxidoreductase
VRGTIVVVNQAAIEQHPFGTRFPQSAGANPSQSKELPVKIVTMIARYLLGLMFLVFGSNMFLNFVPMGPMPTGVAGQFSAALFAAHYFYVVGAIMVISAILLLANRFVGLGLTLLGPVLFNILTYHLLMNPSGIGMGAFATLLWLLIAWEHRVVFARLFAARLEE